MKKALLAIVGLLVAVSAHATFYSDNNPADVLLYSGNPSYTGQFTLAGYNPAAETIVSAHADFSFLGIGYDSFKITIGSDTLTNGNFFGSTAVGDSNLSAWGILDGTGILSYTVSLTTGNRLGLLLLTDAHLTAETKSRSVPDAGATSILLGLGVIGILGAKRRFGSVA